MKTKSNQSPILNASSITLASLMGLTLLSGLILSSSLASADTDSTDEITITVPTSCSMSSSGNTSHTAELGNGQSNSTIGETTITTNCNDNEGFAIYAIGYTEDTLGNNVLTDTSLGSTHDIVTGTATSGNTSNWAMKLSTITSPAPNFPIIISGTTSDTLKQQGDPDYSTFQQVPDDYTKVAYRTSSTDVGTNAEGSILKTTYQAYISPTQAAGTYTGKVKYTMVHPSTADAPIIPVGIEDAYSKAGKQKYNGYYKIQDMTPAMCADVNQYGNSGMAEVIDVRDNTKYHIGKLLDENCWLLDNLALDLTNSTTLAGMNETNTNASNTTLGYLKGDTTRNPSTDASGQYATAKVANWTYSDSYSAPRVKLTYKNTKPQGGDPMASTVNSEGWKVGGYYNYCAASAGSYCYGNGTSYGTSSGDATEDICPKNWRMPTGGYYGEYKTLYSNSNYNTVATLRSALRLPLSGAFNSYDGSVLGEGAVGFFWSSTRSADNNMYNLYVGTSDVYPSNGYSRADGVSVRCLLDS